MMPLTSSDALQAGREYIDRIDRQIAGLECEARERADRLSEMDFDTRREIAETWDRFERKVASLRHERELAVRAMTNLLSATSPAPILIEPDDKVSRETFGRV